MADSRRDHWAPRRKQKTVGGGGGAPILTVIHRAPTPRRPEHGLRTRWRREGKRRTNEKDGLRAVDCDGPGSGVRDLIPTGITQRPSQSSPLKGGNHTASLSPTCLAGFLASTEDMCWRESCNHTPFRHTSSSACPARRPPLPPFDRESGVRHCIFR